MQNNRILSSLGLAQKAGCIASGEYAVEKAVKGGLASLVIVAEDASDNTKKKMKNMTAFYETPLYVYGSKDDLGHCIGKESPFYGSSSAAGICKVCHEAA